MRCLWNAFGRPSTNAPYDQGRTVTHDVSHYLGLLHTFQDGCGKMNAPGCYGTGDLVCDIEPDETSTAAAPPTPRPAGIPDPIRNYMAYTAAGAYYVRLVTDQGVAGSAWCWCIRSPKSVTERGDPRV